MTNSPWSFSVHELQTELALDALTLINDFAAVSHAVPHLSRNDVVAVGADAATLASARRDGHYSGLGPGPGIVVGLLRVRDVTSLVFETEGGLAGFAPTTTGESGVDGKSGSGDVGL